MSLCVYEREHHAARASGVQLKRRLAVSAGAALSVLNSVKGKAAAHARAAEGAPRAAAGLDRAGSCAVRLAARPTRC